MRVIIAGGRDFQNYNLLEDSVFDIIDQNLDLIHSPVEIVCGKAKGADTLGELLALTYNLKLAYFPADWDKLGKRAGYIRNKEMALYAKEDYGTLIAFWDGKSKGTKHMIDLATKEGLKIYIIKY